VAWLSAIFSALHVLALGIGLGAIVLRARALGRHDLPAALRADNAWGASALLWLGSGLARAFGGLEKGTDWYLQNHMFWLKMALFLGVLLLELVPMVTLVRWRMGRGAVGDPATMDRFARLSRIEVALTVAIPFVAAAMARGLGR
jgi:putative membrane protein